MTKLLFSVGKKREAQSTDHILSKKVKYAETDETPAAVTCAPYAPSTIFGAVAIHKDNAYFAAGCNINVFHVPSKNWTKTIPCHRDMFGLAVIGDELVVVGGSTTTETSDSSKASCKISNTIACLSLLPSNNQNTWEEKYPAMRTA